MSKIFNVLILFCLVIGTTFGVANAASNSSGSSQAKIVPTPGSTLISLTFNTGFDVFQIHTTTAAPSLTVNMLDCCIVGDQWKQRTYCLQNGQSVDVRGEANGATSGAFSGSTQVFRKGSQPIDCITEVRYGQGVAIFPAGMDIKFTVPTADAINNTLLTTLTTLPSE